MPWFEMRLRDDSDVDVVTHQLHRKLIKSMRLGERVDVEDVQTWSCGHPIDCDSTRPLLRDPDQTPRMSVGMARLQFGRLALSLQNRRDVSSFS